ncbi:HalOD1 output domain-containing protein [Natrinema versiforme]|uniref:Halobacterial output domain-containing protein n=1 Tax=Natrinema versiforme JCM 10478 TaxID=1227496 RepID=L9XRL9_9EURY|nr:HalOD1 output domain-containing protein [Natrinema versiforme]ELY64444.1 hypothetical protein C489_16864 [Natrinema versiforme JCM 10478]
MSGPDRDPADERPVLAERSHDETTPASIAVVYAIAAALDTDPIECTTEHGFTLYDHIDPEALDSLMGDDRREESVTVELRLNEHLLRVSDRGSVRVLGPTDADDDSNG